MTESHNYLLKLTAQTVAYLRDIGRQTRDETTMDYQGHADCCADDLEIALSKYLQETDKQDWSNGLIYALELNRKDRTNDHA